MVNKNVFKSAAQVKMKANTRNDAGGIAYSLSDKHALAQYAVTGVINDTYYADANTHMARIKEMVSKVDDEFIAKLAVYSRTTGYMKDMPAYLVAVLAARSSDWFSRVFPIVIDNGKMLRNFVTIAWSGEAGRKVNISCSRVRKAIGKYFSDRTDKKLFNDLIGGDPSLKKIIKLSHCPIPQWRGIFDYIFEKGQDKWPEFVVEFENFKAAYNEAKKANKYCALKCPKNIDFRLVDSFMSKDDMATIWEEELKSGGWHKLRMNINNLVKYGVFAKQANINTAAAKLCNAEEIEKSRVFPYQLLTTYNNISEETPKAIKNALHDALELATKNTPRISGNTVVCVDVSGSMSSAVTGHRPGSTSKTRCIDVAALFASCLLKNGENVKILPFDTSVHKSDLDERDTIMTNANKLAKYGGGGTNCAIAMEHIVKSGGKVDNVVYVSDNESWIGLGNNGATGMMSNWKKIVGKNPKAKLVCIDISPGMTSQTHEDKSILKVGGFSDNVFSVVADFLGQTSASNGGPKDFWLKEIDKVDIGL